MIGITEKEKDQSGTEAVFEEINAQISNSDKRHQPTDMKNSAKNQSG